MTKGLVGNLYGLCQSILLDISDIHPNLRKGIERDLVRLETLLSNHGEKVFTLFLPALGKSFDKALEHGALAFDGEPLARPINRRTVIPRLFQGIWMLFFDLDGCLKQDISGDDVRLMRTLLYAFKKFRLQCPPSAVYSTVKEYYDVDRALPPASQEWDTDGNDLGAVRDRSLLDRLAPHHDLFSRNEFSGDDARMLSITQTMGDRISSVLGEYYPQHSRFRHGPGAVSDLTTGRGYKYLFPEWGPRLQHVFPAAEFASANLRTVGETDGWSEEGPPSVEGASELFAVPKTQKGPRLIAAEPTANQWCQQSVRSFLSDAIGRSFISKSVDFTRQDLSGELALAASADGSLATVDLSSASDRVSCWLVERLFRANHSLLAALIACRTRYLVCNIDKKAPRVYKLRKFASMGSALTFPIQSIVFYTLCVSAGFLTEKPRQGEVWTSDIQRLGRQVRVYGDDLIVPVSWMPALEKLFTLLYLKINSSKTFSKGKFRESCGTDAYNGVNVSPGQVLQVFSESNLSTLQGVIDSCNNLFRKGFIRTSNRLLSPIRAELRKLIPFVGIGSESFGIQTSSGFHTSARKRWNKDLQIWQYQTFAFVAKHVDTRRHESIANLLQFFTEDPTSSELAHWESGVFTIPTTVIGRRWVEVPV